MATAKKKTAAKKSPRSSAAKSAPRAKAAAKKPAGSSGSSSWRKATAAKRAPAKKATAAKSANEPRGSKASNAVDAQLARYRSMRDFHVTDEPSGAGKGATREAAARTSAPRTKASGGLPFVIQKHAASHLHYDFRLGWNGVLKSWAVAKGPSYYPGDRRLAVEVEDHPMEYGGFEGIIPKGQYGGGTVMVWDQGTWWPQPGHEDVDAGLRAGSLKFEMSGKKMKGKWTLVRMNPRSTSSSGSRWGSSSKPNWLLIKEHDEYERGKDDPCITDEAPNSAVTGRTMEQIAAQEDHVWNSKETAGTGRAWYRQTSPSASHKTAPETAAKRAPAPRRSSAKPAASGRKTNIAATLLKAGAKSKARAGTRVRSSSASNQGISQKLHSLPQERQPVFLAPELALETTTPPGGTGWLHELKLDGYRIQARKAGENVQLLTRKGLDWTHRMPTIAEAIAALPVEDCTMDGEVVVLGADGTTSFADLQAAFQEGTPHKLTYFAFDLLHLDGRNTRNLPLIERKALLEPLFAGASDNLRYSEHIETGGEEMFHKACQLHAEGIVSKRSDAAYVSGRGGDWLKSKCLREQELVIGGYTFSSEGNDRIGSLLLGYYSGGEFIYAGRTGTGFTQKTRRSLLEQLQQVARRSPAFDRIPNEARRDAQWVEPKLVAQVRFATWTADNLVRQAAFLGLREDKPALEVHREEATVAPRPKASHRASSQIAAMAVARPQAAQPGKSAVASTMREAKKPMAAKSARAKHSVKAPAQSGAPATLRLTHPDKVLDPESGLTKRQLADYYWAVSERMLPHIANRPLSLVRCPEGAGKPCFFQKHVNHMLPPGIGGIDVPNKKTGEPEPYITLDTREALTGLAQMGVLEVHPWGSTNDDLEHPDRLIFDLDPDAAIDWSTLCDAAAEVRKRLKKVGLESFLKTTGGKGLHVVAPIEPKLGWTEVKEAAHDFVLAMERDNPALYLTKMTKSARVGKIYLDYLRNERGATAVAPFSPRARLGAHVSLPLPWSALKLAERPVFSVHDFDAWRDRLRSDPWKAMPGLKQRLDPKKIAKL